MIIRKTTERKQTFTASLQDNTAKKGELSLSRQVPNFSNAKGRLFMTTATAQHFGMRRLVRRSVVTYSGSRRRRRLDGPQATSALPSSPQDVNPFRKCVRLQLYSPPVKEAQRVLRVIPSISLPSQQRAKKSIIYTSDVLSVLSGPSVKQPGSRARGLSLEVTAAQRAGSAGEKA